MKDSTIQKTMALDPSKTGTVPGGPGGTRNTGGKPAPAKAFIPGPARVMYGVYAGALALAVYTGFSYAHPFVAGWRYPWGTSLTQTFNWVLMWAVALVSVVYLYYALVGRPARWSEPLGWFRVLLALLALWFFLLTAAVYRPYGWMAGWLASLFGGPVRVNNVYELFLWGVMLVNLIYAYARWAASPGFPGRKPPKKAE